MPSFDPNPLVSHDTEAAAGGVREARARTRTSRCRTGRSARRCPPGSTFKVIVSAAALENGYTPETPHPGRPTLPARRAPATPIRNAAGVDLPGERRSPSSEALTESCNTGFAQLGVEARRRRSSRTMARGVRLRGRRPDRRPARRRRAPGGAEPHRRRCTQPGRQRRTRRSLAQSAIGQRDVRMTPLQGALIAATVANDGEQMRPYLVQQLLGPDRRPIYNARPGGAAPTGQRVRSPATCRR